MNGPTLNPQPVAGEQIAAAIIEISAAMKALSSTRLTRRAIVTLIHDHSKVSRKEIELVLNNLEALEEIWLKPRKGAK